MRQFESLQVSVPPEGSNVDMKTLEAIADAHAFEVWGDDIARGESFPVTDHSGFVRAYVFPYAFGTHTFPTNATLHKRQPSQSAQFGAIYVAVRRTSHPVLRVDHYLHPLLAHGDEAQKVGRVVLNASDASLTRIYWLGLEQEYFEISAGDRRLLLDVHTLRQVEPEMVLRASPTPAEETEHEVALERLTTPMLTAMEPGRAAESSPVLKVVPLADCVPAVNWTWWCVPTAGAMVMSYWDNYVKGVGGILGYGRLVGYWFDHPKSGHNVPDYIDQLVDPNTGTWRTGFSSFPDFINKTYGYSFSERDVVANITNDWAWTEITAEIDAGRPFIWGVPDHATCAFGYRIATNGKFVVLHTTWGDTEKEQEQEWLYTQGTGLKTIIPGGGTTGQNLVLWSPDGGETALTSVITTVSWYIWGDQIKTAEVSVSSDGGNTWTVIRETAPCNPGWNSCDWLPATITDRARVRVRGFDANGVYIAGDGSQSNLKVLPGPRPVILKTILVNARTDAGGLFSAPHGLERYTPDGYAIRAISVAVQHKNGNWHTLEFSHNVDNRFWWNKDVVGGIIASPDFFEQPVQIVVFAEYVIG